MDPFSITTGVITMLGACRAISKKFDEIKQFRCMPEILCALNNEVSDLQLVLLDIYDHRQELFGNDHASLSPREKRLLQTISSILDRAKQKIKDTEKLLCGLRTTGREKIFQRRFWLMSRDYKNLIILKNDIRDARYDIQSVMSLLGLRQSGRIQVQLSNILNTNASLSGLQNGQHQIEAKLDEILKLQQALRLPSQESIPRDLALPSESQRVDISLERMTHEDACMCPGKATFRGHAKGFWGKVFFGYTAMPSPQHHTSCCHKCKAEAVLVYIFPSWFLSYVLAVSVQHDVSAGLQFSLSIRPTLGPGHVVWDLLERHDISELKRQFSTGQISPEARGTSGGGLLAHALAMGNLETTKFLLKIGLNPNTERQGGRTVYHDAWDRILGNTRGPEWSSQAMALFPSPNFEELYGFNALHKAILGISNQSVVEIIDSGPSLLNRTDALGRSPLAWAAWRGEEVYVRLLLSHKALVDEADSQGNTALMYAAQYQRFGCMKMLLKAGADASRTNVNSLGLLHALLLPSLGQQSPTERIRALERVLSAGAGINVQSANGLTPLHFSTEWGPTELTQCLLDRGADLRICERGSYSPLLRAVQSGRHHILKVLLEHGADQDGSTPEFGTFAHVVAQSADVQTLRALLDHGRLRLRDINIKNRTGSTPLQVGFQRDNIDAEWRDLFMQFLKRIDEDSAHSCADLRPMEAGVQENVVSAPREMGVRDSGASCRHSDAIQSKEPDSDSDDEFEDALETL